MKNNNFNYILIILMLVISAVFSLNLFFHQRTARDKLNIGVFPYIIGTWQGRDITVTEKEYDILETRNLILREYTNSEGKRIFLFIIYSETNRCVFHPPEVCLIGSGVKITDKKSVVLDSGKGEIAVNELYAEDKNSRELILYCYKAGGLYTDNFYLQQVSFAFNQLLGRRIQGATVRVSVSAGENTAETSAVLRDFFLKSIEVIDSLR